MHTSVLLLLLYFYLFIIILKNILLWVFPFRVQYHRRTDFHTSKVLVYFIPNTFPQPYSPSHVLGGFHDSSVNSDPSITDKNRCQKMLYRHVHIVIRMLKMFCFCFCFFPVKFRIIYCLFYRYLKFLTPPHRQDLMDLGGVSSFPMILNQNLFSTDIMKHPLN